MPQLVGTSPLRKIDSNYDLGFHPNTRLHFLSGQSLAPAALGLFRQIHEGAFLGFEIHDFCKDLTAGRRNEARSHTRGKE